jgi:type III restriction enzyme
VDQFLGGRSVRIDSKLLDKLDRDEGQSRDEAAKALRDIIDSVGQKGKPGEQVRCVVSVSMLTEGWDATNVTHILGVRAFGSQLLCEQVVGRGLRRMNYTPDPETGRLPAEYVDVYGIPFSLIPYKGKPKEPGPEPVYHHVYAVTERDQFEIRMPVVESYTYALRGSGITFDWDRVEPLRVDKEPTAVFVTATRGYADEPVTPASGDFIKQDREEYYKTVRMQQLVFRLAQLITDDLVLGAATVEDSPLKTMAVSRQQLFPEIVGFLNRYIDEYVTFAVGVDRRELGLEKYANLLRERVRDNILPAASSRDAPLLPIVNSYNPFASTSEVNYRTTRKVMPLTKSHLNLAVIQSKWESETVDILEDLDCVECYTPNDRNVGLAIPYEYQQNDHRYEPDFVAELSNGIFVMIEIKGRAGEIHDEDRVLAKNAAAKKWVAAVNNSKRFGHWEYEICKEMPKLRSVLEAYVPDAEVARPFEFVDPAEREPYVDCVPLVSLRAAAGAFSEEQLSLDPADQASDWVTFETTTRIEPGMFVARVQGASMEPKIPYGSYCLFRNPPEGSRQNRTVLVRHSGIEDSETGGEFTVKVYTSEKTPDPEEGWAHTRIILKPLNPAFEPIELTPEDEGEVQVIAEFVEEVSNARTDG